MASTTASAGVKYWNNPAFKAYDADSYVSDGLVLHYDGLRNQGLEEPHSTTATTWKNLGSLGGEATLGQTAKYAGQDKGAWGEKGYAFAGASYFVQGGFTLPESKTVQALVDADFAAQSNVGKATGSGNDVCHVSGGSSAWRRGCTVTINSDDPNGTGNKNRWFQYRWTGSSANDLIAKAASQATALTYVTAITDVPYVEVFEGTARYATTATAGKWSGYKKDLDAQISVVGTTFAVGGSDGANDTENLTGTVKSVRVYDRALSNDEIVWNRAVDDWRYFGKTFTTIPLTNAVVRSSCSGATGDQPSGVYAVDADGFTFTAPASTVANGRAYTCTGYTLETWNGSDWADATTVAAGADGASVAVSSSDRVRITWNWNAGDGLVTYGVEDYVQDGLVLHYDGILNDGPFNPHNPSAVLWQNIAVGYEHWPMHWVSYVDNGDSAVKYALDDTSQGEWIDNGFAFGGRTYFAKWSDGKPFTLSTHFTIQNVVDAKVSEQSGIAYLFFPKTHNEGGLAVTKSKGVTPANTYYFLQDGNAGTRPYFYAESLRYATAILSDGVTEMFEGTERPDSSDEARRKEATKTPVDKTITWYSVGANHDKKTVSEAQGFTGKMHSFRYYNRALDNEDLAQNRRVDDYRFFGSLPVTNVVVASTYSYLHGNEAEGPHQVSGKYTFSAPATVTAENGTEYACAGYTVEKWNVNESGDGGWGAVVMNGSGNAFVYRVADYEAKIRLTWHWKATKGLRTAADYKLSDYSSGGLVLHYDGLLNQGADAERSTTATTWVNLGESGATYDLSRGGGTYITANSYWTEQGYHFDGKTFFRSTVPLTMPVEYAIQMLIDAKVADYSDIGYVWYPNDGDNWEASSIAVRNASNGYQPSALSFATHLFTSGRSKIDGKEFSYATAMMHPDYAAIFAGTDEGEAAKATLSAGKTVTNSTFKVWNIGGKGWQNAGQSMIGTIKNFRFYDRALTDEELGRNRNVDSARYFGVLATTNVVISAGKYGETEGALVEAPGAYKVEGSWTFKAANSVRVDGRARDIAGCWVETLVDGVATAREYVAGGEYTYTEGESPATVRVTWRWTSPGMTIIIR